VAGNLEDGVAAGQAAGWSGERLSCLVPEASSDDASPTRKKERNCLSRLQVAETSEIQSGEGYSKCEIRSSDRQSTETRGESLSRTGEKERGTVPRAE